MILFVSAIDTEAGKTIATGLLGRYGLRRGRRAITQKLVQTGCEGDVSPDVQTHRAIMGLAWTDADRAGDTCPYRLPLAASPHLAARAAGVVIDPDLITAATQRLSAVHQDVIIEGVGGLCVPLTPGLLLVDYVAARGYRTVLVSSARLGSINHTLMSLEIMKARGIPVAGIIYNRAGDADPAVAMDSRALFEQALADHDYPRRVVDMPRLDGDRYPDIDFGALYN